MGAVVVVVAEVALVEQGGDLFRGEPLTRFDGRLTRHHVQQAVEEVAAGELLGLGVDLLDDRLEQFGRVSSADERRETAEGDGIPAKVLDQQPEFRQ